MLRRLLVTLPLALLIASSAFAAESWNPASAAQYLDRRAAWWETWPRAQRDHETVCISCHTILPYVLSRSALNSALNQSAMPAPQKQALDYIKKRVSRWSEMEPFYSDAKSGVGKSRESRATESVLNALVLAAAQPASAKQLDPLTRQAFDSAWALQLTSGEHAGAWDWQVFKLAPWEAADSQYQGATFMALAIGRAPASYRRDHAIQPNLERLRAYLKRDYASQPLLNKIVLLWAANRWPVLLSRSEKRQLVAEIAARQRTDGGWNSASLGAWQRSDHTAQDTASDGYATAIATLALRRGAAWQKGRTWLEENQNKEDGSWRALSLNKQRDPESDAAKFMTDAATGYAVLALTAGR